MRNNTHHWIALMNACYNIAILGNVHLNTFHQPVSAYSLFHFHGVDVGQRLAYWVQIHSFEKLFNIFCVDKLLVEAIFNQNLEAFAHFFVRVTFEI